MKLRIPCVKYYRHPNKIQGRGRWKWRSGLYAVPERLSLHLHILGLSLHRVRWLRGDHRFWAVENVDNVALRLGLTIRSLPLRASWYMTARTHVLVLNWGSWKVKQTKLLRISCWRILQSWKSSLAEPFAISITLHVFCLLIRPGLKLSEKRKRFLAKISSPELFQW